MYKSLYECECEFLTPKLPFRDHFAQHMLNDIQKKYHRTERFTYVSQNPGGFLADAKIIEKLLAAGYNSLELVFIEPLLTENFSILQACLDFREWCRQQKIILKTYFFRSIHEYVTACTNAPELCGHVFITIDPDDKKTTPNFENIMFRKKFNNMVKKILRPEATFYYLYFQKVAGNPYRHMLIGHVQENTLSLNHWYGIESLQEHYINQIFSTSHSKGTTIV